MNIHVQKNTVRKQPFWYIKHTHLCIHIYLYRITTIIRIMPSEYPFTSMYGTTLTANGYLLPLRINFMFATENEC